MSATATLNIEELLADITPENPKILYGVSWEDYVELTEATLNETNLKMSFNRGVLKIMGQGFNHENRQLIFQQTLPSVFPQRRAFDDFLLFHNLPSAL